MKKAVFAILIIFSAYNCAAEESVAAYWNSRSADQKRYFIIGIMFGVDYASYIVSETLDNTGEESSIDPKICEKVIGTLSHLVKDKSGRYIDFQTILSFIDFFYSRPENKTTPLKQGIAFSFQEAYTLFSE